jgi:hypothetical protein
MVYFPSWRALSKSKGRIKLPEVLRIKGALLLCDLEVMGWRPASIFRIIVLIVCLHNPFIVATRKQQPMGDFNAGGIGQKISVGRQPASTYG